MLVPIIQKTRPGGPTVAPRQQRNLQIVVPLNPSRHLPATEDALALQRSRKIIHKETKTTLLPPPSQNSKAETTEANLPGDARPPTSTRDEARKDKTEDTPVLWFLS